MVILSKVMETKNRLGIFIFLGLLSIAVSLPVAVKKYTDASRNVVVKGLCEKQVDADRAIWPIVYKEGGNSVAALSSIVATKNKAVVGWLKDAGFTDAEINVSSPKIEDLASTGYNEHRAYDYVLTSVITVCTDRVKDVVDLQKHQFDLLSKGIAIGSGNTWEYPVTYEYTSLSEIKAGMVEEAILNARASAEKFAKDSGSRLGKIISATQGQFSINDRDAHTPYIKTVRVVSTVNYSLK